VSDRTNEIRSTFCSTLGGVMTKEVGAITGELELVTRLESQGADISVRYAGAEECYTVEGSPVCAGSGLSLPALHERIVAHLTTPGDIVNGNEEARSLRNFSSTA
jgi:hypothetical protein